MAAATQGNMDVQRELEGLCGPGSVVAQPTADGLATFWVPAGKIREALRYLKCQAPQPYRMLYDLTAIDERERRCRAGQPAGDFTVIYHLLSFERNVDVRLKVALEGERLSLPSVIDLWPCADWYEREVWDMFGIEFAGHPRLRRLLMPPWWQGHPLRKEYPSRATEMPSFSMTEDQRSQWQEALRFVPEDWGMKREGGEFETMFLNIGPHHPGTHGVLRIVLQLAGQEIVDAVCDIGYHHRGAEKMGERQSWHTYIPYTDRVDYLGGVLNNFPYVLAVEKLAGIEVPGRAKVIRIMLAELFRIISHLVFYGTLSQDLGQMSPVFYMFSDREKAFEIVEAITGARMHPGWFRIGGVAQYLPEGWEKLVADFLAYMPARLREYDRMVMGNRTFKRRTQGIGQITTDEAIEWGATGPMLRACGLEWDFRKKRPYGGYDQFEFDIPTGARGDSYDRAVVHVEEMRQSLRIIEQCARNMPAGPYKADHPLTTPPPKDRTMKDIETLIDHFLGVSWGPVIPPGEAAVGVEGAKGNNTYYLISDGGTSSYRTRIRTPSFPHIQMVPMMSRGLTVSDLIAILGSVDFVLADVDR
ncbi:MAG: NADH-quinone oxidoreductase subunit C/D [Phycisphaerae bacterium]|jgi:NADH-quinone oxidoreductase subunit C/D